MSDVTDIDLVELVDELILPQFKGKPVISAILKGPMTVLQDSLDVAVQIAHTLDLENAEGEQLDLIGKLLNVDRILKTDEQYKLAINVQIIINKSTGTGDSLIETLDSVVGAGKYNIIETFPAEVQVRLYESQEVLTAEIINAILPIGVNGIFFQNPYTGKTVWEVSEIEPLTENPNSILPDVSDLGTTEFVIADVIFT